MKKQWSGFFAGMLAAVVLFCAVSPAAAVSVGQRITVYPGVNIYVDDVRLHPTDVHGNPVQAFIYNGTTYLPVRAVSQALGKPVQWEGSTTSVYLGKHTGTSPAVLLQNLDYFTGQPWDTAETEQDNLGKTRENIFYPRRNAKNVYLLNGQYRKMTGTLFQRYENRSNQTKTTLTIYGDGKLLYQSAVNGGVKPIDFSIDLTGVLELQVEFDDNSYWGSRYAGLSNCGLWT